MLVGLTDLEIRAFYSTFIEPDGAGGFRLKVNMGAAPQATLDAILAKIIAAPATEAGQNTLIAKDFATQATLAAVLAKIIAAPATEAGQNTLIAKDFATQATLAAVLAKIIAAPATEAKQGQGIDIDNAVLTANKPVPNGGKAVTTLTYAPGYAANDAALSAFDKDNGALLVNQANLNSTEDSVTSIVGESTKQTYSASIIGLVIGAAATDIFEIIGSATKLVRVKRIQVSGTATGTAAIALVLVKRSAANTLGTSTAPSPVSHDSNNIAATSALKAYTANPTLGAIVGNIRSTRQTLTTPGGAIVNVPTVFEFGNGVNQNIILRAVTETLAVNLNGVTVAGETLDIDITWTEE